MSSQLFGGGPAFADPRLDNRPLTDQEQQLVGRLLSDPLSFPMTFKAWLVAFLEISDLALNKSNVIGLTTSLGEAKGQSGTLSVLTTGTAVLWCGPGTPSGSLPCNGAAYDTTVYAGLFKALGYRHGGSGSVFNVPNIPAPVANTEWVIVT